MNALIFAGGSGSRLWPASRKNKPKQFLSFFGDLTMLEKTYQRINKSIPNDKIFIATSGDYVEEVSKQLPDISINNFLLEPVRKNRGPALGVLMLYLKKYSDDQYFTTVWSDDHINQEDIYHSSIGAIEKYLKSNPDDIVGMGVSPNQPSTSFRYVQTGEKVSDEHTPIYNVNKFVDKPDSELAKSIYSSGNHFWNTGYFISSSTAILKMYQENFPECYELLMELEPFIGTDKQVEKINEIYPKMPSFDFEEIFFKNPSLLKMAPVSFDWMDLGRWDAIKDVQSQKGDNLTKGLTVSHNTESTLIFNYNPDQLVSTLHVNNLVIVVTKEAVLVANKDKSEDLKKIIEKLDEDINLNKFL